MSESITKKAFSQQLLDLKQRFSRIANNLSEGTHEQKAACACGGKLLARASKAGLLPFELPAPAPVKNISDDDTLTWINLWIASMIVLSRMFPDLFPSNPHSIHWEERDSPDVGLLRVGVQKKQDWRIRVENYAVACTVLAESLAEPAADSMLACSEVSALSVRGSVNARAGDRPPAGPAAE